MPPTDFGEEARRLQEGVHRGDYQRVAQLVPDEMAHTFVACGTQDQVRAKLEPPWDVADPVRFVPPTYGLEPAKLVAYSMAIGETFYN